MSTFRLTKFTILKKILKAIFNFIFRRNKKNKLV